MKNKLLISLFLSLISSHVFAAFIALRLYPRFSYQDKNTACMVTTGNTRYLNLNGYVKEGKLVEANLKDSNLTFPNRTSFTEEELKGVKVKEDSSENYYLASLPLGSRLLRWIIANIDAFEIKSGIFCSPQKKLATITPEPETFNFVAKDAATYVSEIKRFKGELGDKTPYAVQLGITQVQADF